MKTSLVDFERAAYTEKPKNVTQFVQYITTMASMLNGKGFRLDVDGLRDAAKAYKKSLDKKHFDGILKLIK